MNFAMIPSRHISHLNILIPTIKITFKTIYTNIAIIITKTSNMIKTMFLGYKKKEYFTKPTILHKYDPTKYIFNKNTHDIIPLIKKQIQFLYNYDKQTYLILFILLCFYIMYNIHRELVIMKGRIRK
jgi:hypothetical protein